jgi:hypothetical protein
MLEEEKRKINSVSNILNSVPSCDAIIIFVLQVLHLMLKKPLMKTNWKIF